MEAIFIVHHRNSTKTCELMIQFTGSRLNRSRRRIMIIKIGTARRKSRTSITETALSEKVLIVYNLILLYLTWKMWMALQNWHVKS